MLLILLFFVAHLDSLRSEKRFFNPCKAGEFGLHHVIKENVGNFSIFVRELILEVNKRYYLKESPVRLTQFI